MAKMNFDEACAYIESVRAREVRGRAREFARGADGGGGAGQGLDFTGVGLARAAAFYALLENPQARLPHVIHVGGTSGKGSTALMIHDICAAAGLRVGLYTSPALESPRDRTRISGRVISRARYAALVEHMRGAIEEMGAGKFGVPSVFEISVGLAFLWFAGVGGGRDDGPGRAHSASSNAGKKATPVDVAVIEVGVGGLIDATNVVRTDVSVITSVSLAHQRILGRNLAAIARNKSGIIKAGQRACVTATDSAEALEVIRAQCARVGVPLRKIAPLAPAPTRMSTRGSLFSYTTTTGVHYNNLHVRMIGDAQVTNAICAIEAVEASQILRALPASRRETSIRAGLSRAQLAGRLEIVSRRPLVVLDGAHNHPKAAFLARALRDIILKEGAPNCRLVLVFGVKKRIIRHLAPLASTIVICEPSLGARHRVAPASQIAAVAGEFARPDTQIIIQSNPSTALAAARALARPQDVVCVTGSLHLVGMLRAEASVASTNKSTS